MRKKRYIFKYFKTLGFFIIGLIFLIPQNIVAQDDEETETVEKIRPIVKMECHKNNDGSRTIIAIFSYKDKEAKEFYKVKGAPINFYMGTDSLIELGTFETDIDGKAICKIEPDTKFPKNEEGYINFSVEFEGNKSFKARGNEVDVIDIDLELTLEEVDSVKTVTVKASKILANDEKEPINEEELPIFVQRMFSQLKVGEVFLEEGEGSIEFPSDIPGDTLGMLQVAAKFVDHDDYAFVSKSETLKWGVVTNHHEIYHPRSLWTQVAPIWMIVTLSIMLAGVWGHYIFVIVQLIKIKKEKDVI